jgi:hypothetical protein
VAKGPAADATDALQPWGFLCNPVMKTKMMINFCPFPSNGALVERNWQGKSEELGEKPVPVPLCPPQIPHGLTRDRTRASAVGGRRLNAWAMARPSVLNIFSKKKTSTSELHINHLFCIYFITIYYHTVCVILVFKRIPEDDPNRDRNMSELKFCHVRTFSIITVL